MTDTVVGLDVDDLKDHLRYKLRRTRAAYSHPSRRHDARCAALAENVFQALNGAQAVAAYVSVGDEPCTRLLIDELHAAGVQVLLPVLGPTYRAAGAGSVVAMIWLPALPAVPPSLLAWCWGLPLSRWCKAYWCRRWQLTRTATA